MTPKDSEMSTFDDVVKYITFHFTDSDGLIAQIEKGNEIHEEYVQDIEVALQHIGRHWSQEESVPKGVVRLFYNIIPRLEQSALLYEEKQAAINDFSMNLSQWIEDIFSSPAMSEQYASALVCQHIFGTPPFVVGLRLGRIDEDSVEELFEALNALSTIWKEREYMPKIMAHAMIGSQALILSVVDLYGSSKAQRLKEIERQLIALVGECLN